VTEEFLTSISDGQYTRYMPVDWPYDEGTEAFDKPRALMVADYELRKPDGFAGHVDESYAALVEAMDFLRKETAFPSDVFVDVLSTDPSARLEQLEDRAVRLLNSPGIYAEWRQVMDNGAG
jgi:hypothetical protein